MMNSTRRETLAMASSATLHCLTGCAIGEIIGLVVGTHFNWDNSATTLFAIVLAFTSGYSLSTLPLVRHGMSFPRALRLVFAADTVSIITMELVDNLVMWVIPGAMNAHYFDLFFWVSTVASLGVAFMAAWPINYWLLHRGKGHALTHHHMHDHTSMHDEMH